MKKKLLTILTAALVGCCLLAGCGKKEDRQAILVVSFGTSYNDSRDITIGAIEEDIAAAFPEYDLLILLPPPNLNPLRRT